MMNKLRFDKGIQSFMTPLKYFGYQCNSLFHADRRHTNEHTLRYLKYNLVFKLNLKDKTK